MWEGNDRLRPLLSLQRLGARHVKTGAANRNQNTRAPGPRSRRHTVRSRAEGKRTEQGSWLRRYTRHECWKTTDCTTCVDIGLCDCRRWVLTWSRETPLSDCRHWVLTWSRETPISDYRHWVLTWVRETPFSDYCRHWVLTWVQETPFSDYCRHWVLTWVRETLSGDCRHWVLTWVRETRFSDCCRRVPTLHWNNRNQSRHLMCDCHQQT